ncbi:hypothetical protein VPH35_076487 [Triticum aestivum]|uniref:RNase H type-1 domain-containing protein n=1 Tax=Aegilops tauschii subsp. strangulata TaxID=200361 RepID=A0A453H6S2_AEGTS
MDMSRGEAGGSMIARDDQGSFLATRFRHYPGTTSPLIGEALACRDAMVFAMEQGWTNVQVETDCQVFANEWKNTRDLSDVGLIIRETKVYLSSFQGFELYHISRDANGLACKLARHALLLGMGDVTFSYIPEFLSDEMHYVRWRNE